ncbi:MAG: protease inhibitor I42 family protein [Chloroflexota bacterium]
MKWVLLIMCAGVLMAPALAGCATTDGNEQAEQGNTEAEVQLSCEQLSEHEDVSKEVELQVGGTLTVTLCSNPSTGFGWGEPEIGDPGVVQQSDHEFIPAQGEKPPPGAPGRETWVFEAVGQGQTTMSLAYSQAWEGGEKDRWTLTVDVTVT